jgi:hypothetical protein
MVNPFLTKLMADARIDELRASATRFPARIIDEPAPTARRNRHEGDAITLRFAGPRVWAPQQAVPLPNPIDRRTR